MTQTLTVDVAFPLHGDALALDHGYPLFGAVSRLIPRLHHEPKWGIHPVYGRRTGPGKLQLLPSSLLTIRLPSTDIGQLLILAGQSLDVAGSRVMVGIPRVFPLKPRPALRSRLVTIKSFKDDGGGFEGALRRQLVALAVSERAKVEVGARRVVRVSNHTIVGFPVVLDGLSPDESVRVQSEGLGGRRHMGAGLFLAPGDAA